MSDISKFDKSFRTRNWSCIIYPDSLPDDYFDRILSTGLPVCLSPLHEDDTWLDDVYDHPSDGSEPSIIYHKGELKKSHYHVIILYSGVKSIYQVAHDFSFFNISLALFDPVKSVAGSVRYFTHVDYPDKAQYGIDEFIPFNGFDPLKYYNPDAVSEVSGLVGLLDFIDQNQITEYRELLILLRSNMSDNNPLIEEYFKLATNSRCNCVCNYLKSCRYINPTAPQK